MQLSKIRDLAQQEKMLCGLTFVNHLNTPPSKLDKEDNAPTIRSHAMREVIRRKNLIQRLSKTPAPKHADPAMSEESYHCQAVAQPLSAREVCCNTNVRLGNFGDFNPLPPDASQHLHYFVHGFTPSTFPTAHIRHECDILAIALTVRDPSLLHALCAISIAHRSLEQEHKALESLIEPGSGETTGLALLRHKQNAIAWLQKSLSTHGKTRNPSSQATIVLLLTIETLCGDTVTANTHKFGLMELVRRTTPVSGSSSLLRSDILMSDIKSAASGFSELSIKPDVEWIDCFDRLKHMPFTAHRPDLALLGSGFMTPAARESLGNELVLLLLGMRQLVNVLELHSDAGIDASAITGTSFLVLEHELLSYRSVNEKAGAFNESIGKCCRLAALLYCNLCVWKWPKASTLIKNLSERLCQAVSEWTLTTPASGDLPLVLWFNFMGTFAASNEGQLRWYLKGITAVSNWIGIKTDLHLQSVLQTFFCADKLLEEHISTVYREIVHSYSNRNLR